MLNGLYGNHRVVDSKSFPCSHIIRSSIDAPGWGRILTESPRDTSLPLTFFIIESPMTTILFFTLGWWASGWRSLKLTCNSLNLSSFGTFDSFFLSFRKALLCWYHWYFYHLSFSWQSAFEQRRFEPVSAYSLCHLSVVYFNFPKVWFWFVVYVLYHDQY